MVCGDNLDSDHRLERTTFRVATVCIYDRRDDRRQHYQSVFSAKPWAFLRAFCNKIQGRCRLRGRGRRRVVSVHGDGIADELPHRYAGDADRLYLVRPAWRQTAGTSRVLSRFCLDIARGPVSLETIRRVFSAVRDIVRGVCMAGIPGPKDRRIAGRIPTRDRPVSRRSRYYRTRIVDRRRKACGSLGRRYFPRHLLVLQSRRHPPLGL